MQMGDLLTSVNLRTILNLRSFALTVKYSKLSSSKSMVPALENMTITGVKMKNFDFSVLPELKTLYIQNCGATSVDWQGNLQLRSVLCWKN